MEVRKIGNAAEFRLRELGMPLQSCAVEGDTSPEFSTLAVHGARNLRALERCVGDASHIVEVQRALDVHVAKVCDPMDSDVNERSISLHFESWRIHLMRRAEELSTFAAKAATDIGLVEIDVAPEYRTRHIGKLGDPRRPEGYRTIGVHEPGARQIERARYLGKVEIHGPQSHNVFDIGMAFDFHAAEIDEASPAVELRALWIART